MTTPVYSFKPQQQLYFDFTATYESDFIIIIN